MRDSSSACMAQCLSFMAAALHITYRSCCNHKCGFLLWHLCHQSWHFRHCSCHCSHSLPGLSQHKYRVSCQLDTAHIHLTYYLKKTSLSETLQGCKDALQAAFPPHQACLAWERHFLAFLAPPTLPGSHWELAQWPSCDSAQSRRHQSRHQCHLAGCPGDTVSLGQPSAALRESRAPLQRRPEPFKEERGAEINCLLAFLPRPPSPPPPSPPPPHTHPIHPAGR